MENLGSFSSHLKTKSKSWLTPLWNQFSSLRLYEILWGIFFLALFLPQEIHLSEQESFWSGVFMPFSTISWPISYFALTAALLFSGIFSLQTKNNTYKNEIARESVSMFLPAFFLFIFFWEILFVTKDWESIRGIYFLLNWFLAGTTVFFLSQHQNLKKIALYTWGIGALIEALLAIFQTFSAFLTHFHSSEITFVLRSEYGQILRASGTFLHPNILGFMLVFTFFLLESVKTEKFWKVVRPVLLLGIFFTFSRSALFALGLGIFLQVFASHDKFITQVKKIIPVTLFIGISLGIRLGLDKFSTSNVERVSQLKIALQEIISVPVWGNGIGSFPTEMAKVANSFPWELQPVHNLFFLWGVEMGLPAMLALIFFFFWTTKRLWKMPVRSSRNTLLGIFGTIGVFAFFDHLLITSPTGLFGCVLFLAILIQELRVLPQDSK